MKPHQAYQKHLFKTVLLVSVAAIAYWAYGVYSPSNAPPPSSSPVTEVEAMTLNTQEVQVYKDLPSRTTAFKVADIRPQASGIIIERLFEEGSSVTQGQLLYQIDPAPYKANYDRTIADLNRTKTNAKLAEAKANRYTSLVKSKTISQQAYEDVVAARDQAVAEVAVAQAAVTAAEVNLNYTHVTAPISGRIGKSSMTAGALVTANQTAVLATITQLDPIYVDLILPSRDLLRLRTQLNGAQKLKVTLLNEDGQLAHNEEGELEFSEVTVDQTTGTVLLRALFANPERTLLPGMFVRARIHLLPVQAVLVPQAAAQRGADGKLSVWVIDADGKIQLQPIVADQAVNKSWLVESGIDDGTKIVTKGFQKTSPGATVKAVMTPTQSSPKPDKAE